MRSFYRFISTVSIIPLYLLSTLLWAQELVIGTTFSEQATSQLIKALDIQSDAYSIRTLNRTSTSLKQLLLSERASDIDLVLSSSPMLFYALQQKGLLATIALDNPHIDPFVPSILHGTTVAFSISGYGILSNIPLLEQLHLSAPTNWRDLVDPRLYQLVIISSPSRSETNHIMLEALLQQHGWNEGWALINQIVANVGTISSRSFGVVDKIQANLGAAGITIDNYANLLTNSNADSKRLVFNYFPHFPVSPTFIAITAKSRHAKESLAFVRFLLSEKGQSALSNSETGKYPILPLSDDNLQAKEQQFLFSQPQIDYLLAIKRQELVKLLFEHQITYRLNQLQENWQLVYQKERAVGHALPALRALLNGVPVTAEQASSDSYLAEFDINKEFLRWQAFFSQQQIKLIKALDTL